MQGSSSSSKALLVAFEVFCVLVGVSAYVLVFVGLGGFDISKLFLVSVAVVIALFTVVVYQSIKISDTAKHLAKGMAKDILLYSRELFSELYRGSPVPYILIDVQGAIESTNYAAVRLFGIEEGQLDGENIFAYLESDDQNQIALFSEYLKQGLFVNEKEVRIRRLDGTTRYALLSLFSFKDPNEKRKGLLTLVDVTKQKQIDKAKTEFVSLASHQLRTPISAMKWNVELLHSASPETLTPLQEDYILKLAHGLTRMDLLIDDFLNVSKFELGTLKTDIQKLELGAVVTEILDEQRKKASSRNIVIEEEWSERPFLISSDSHLLSMIIGNLLSNAIKYTKDGGTVRLRFEIRDEHIIIVVSDTGIGIPKDEQDQIFTKIFRASNARQQVADGTGLGLYIVREATKVLGGTITFVSEVGSGTTFTVVLPKGS